MELLDDTKKYFYVPLNRACYIASQTNPVGSTVGGQNQFVTIRFTDDGDTRCFPLELADELLRGVKKAMQVEDTEIEETTDEEDEQTVIL